MKVLPGINIQTPFSTLLLEGRKIVETRLYPLPRHYVGKELYLIETPGCKGKFKARIVGTIVFGESFEYQSKKQFFDDFDSHLVDQHSDFAWKDKSKWGWPVLKVKKFKNEFPAPSRRGISFTKEISI